MTSYTRWQDIRPEHVARAGGEEAVRAGKEELLAQVTGRKLAELRRARGLTQQEVADRMGVSKGRVSQIERGHLSGQEVLARFDAFDPLFREALPLSLEEIFIYEMGGEDYAVRDIVL